MDINEGHSTQAAALSQIERARLSTDLIGCLLRCFCLCKKTPNLEEGRFYGWYQGDDVHFRFHTKTANSGYFHLFLAETAVPNLSLC